MTEYNIAGIKLKISTELENERYLEKSMNGLIAGAEDIFLKWYSAKGNCISVYEEADEIQFNLLWELSKKAVEIIKAQGVYSVDENMLIEGYLSDCFEDFDASRDSMMDEIAAIEGQQAQMEAYRKARKQGRSRYVGYGFTMGSKIKQGMKAGALNAATGLGHSVVNSIGNVGSGISASLKKADVYNRYKSILAKAYIVGAKAAKSEIRTAISEETNLRFKFVTVTEADQAEAIFQNYMSGKIPEKAKKQQIVQALALNPYSRDIYQRIWDYYGDQSGDLRKMSDFFGRNLDGYISEAVEQMGKAMFTEKCAAYEQAFDKKEAAVNIETQIRETLDWLVQYCADNHLEEEMISVISQCRKLLEEVDISLRTVEGNLYYNRESAQAVRDDYAAFYGFLKGKDVFREETRQEVLALEFGSETMRGQVESLFEKEKELRTPELAYPNLYRLLTKMLPAEIWNEGWIEIPKHIGAFEQKEKTVRSLTGMSDSELVLVFFGRSSNGKTGVALTNINLRIYSKGVFSSENVAHPLEGLGRIRCLGENRYSVDIVGGEPIQIDLSKRKMAVEDQIIFGKTLEKLIQILVNISAADRENMFRILHPAVICVCGAHLIAGEKICPSCSRILRDSGEMVESEACPRCGELILAGKKFCSKCGNPLRIEAVEAASLEDAKTSEADPTVEAAAEAAPTVAEAAPAAVQITKCPECGNFVKPGKKFCSACGRKIVL